MKLIIQIPCLNECEQLGATLADLPRRVPGIDCIEVLVVDDGSTDGTGEVAEQLGVHHVVRFAKNRGLAAAFMAGLDAGLRLGADVIVNTDADNQYRGADIAELVEPILSGRADVVIGDRQTDTMAEFSTLKRFLQRVGSRVVRRLSGSGVNDCTSGFRAMSRKAALTLFVHNRFTYTLETIIQAGEAGLAVENVPVRTNPKMRESRLFRSVSRYLTRSVPVILRSFSMYWPMLTFGWLSALFLMFGLALIGRFLLFYIADPNYNGHIQSLMAGMGSVVLAFIIGLLALLGDLMAANRRLMQEVLLRVRRLEAAPEGPSETFSPFPEVYCTGAEPWLADRFPLHARRPSAGSSWGTSTTSTAPGIPSPVGSIDGSFAP